MNTKLTLTLEKEIIEAAKKYASKKGRSLSEMVENYFKFLIDAKEIENTEDISPRIKKLQGILKVDADFDYKKTLEAEINKKHGV
ncbi:MAG: DUF6364 family protein [Fulvivirga sp.]|uniref:DUF6364 family protein n=1 Tax=Fulvivirga sp. TaxID=1931237 RepID=UPI0032EEA165